MTLLPLEGARAPRAPLGGAGPWTSGGPAVQGHSLGQFCAFRRAPQGLGLTPPQDSLNTCAPPHLPSLPLSSAAARGDAEDSEGQQAPGAREGPREGPEDPAGAPHGSYDQRPTKRAASNNRLPRSRCRRALLPPKAPENFPASQLPPPGCRQASARLSAAKPQGLLLVPVSSPLLGAPVIGPSVPSVPREPGPERSGAERGGGVAGTSGRAESLPRCPVPGPPSTVQPDSPPRWRQEVHPGRGGVLHSQQVRRPQRGEEQDARQRPEDPGPGQGAPGFGPRKHRALHPSSAGAGPAGGRGSSGGDPPLPQQGGGEPRAGQQGRALAAPALPSEPQPHQVMRRPRGEGVGRASIAFCPAPGALPWGGGQRPGFPLTLRFLVTHNRKIPRKSGKASPTGL